MNQSQKIFGFCYIVFITPIIGVGAYFFLSVVFGPFLIERIDEIPFNITILILIFGLIGVFWRSLLKIKEKPNKIEKDNKFRSRWPLFMSLLAFIMAPFGFAGLLDFRGGHISQPYSGGFCILTGLLFLISYFKRKE
jgi:hypothetical protein